MEKTVLLSLCSLCFLAFTLTSEAKNNQKTDASSEIIERTAFVESVVDTIPAKGTYRIHKKTDEQEINIEVEDGDIKELHIDGKEIKPEEFSSYDDVIQELFGEMEAPPAAYGYNFEMPAMPPLPDMQGVYVMPPMPAMPPMGEMKLKEFYSHDGNFGFGNGEHFKMFFPDSLHQTQIIIIDAEGDSNVIVTPHGGTYRFMTPSGQNAIEIEQYMRSTEDWKKHGEEWKKQAEDWKVKEKEWKKMSEEWQNNWQENAHGLQLKAQEMEILRKNLDEEVLEKLRDQGHLELELEQLYGAAGAEAEGIARGRVYGLRQSRGNMADAMVEEGLIESGEEAIIQLTPDKLKINGKKMDDGTHKKYLRMYEAQQGIELTGNSRVEFKVKTRRSM